MADYLGSINLLPDARVSDKNRTPSFVCTCATNCDLFPFDEKRAKENHIITEDVFDNPDLYFQHLAEKFDNFWGKVKKGIDVAPQRAENEIVKLANRKWASIINPNPEPKSKFPINFEGLTPKMKEKVLKLREYAQKELKITILVNDAARTPEQQKLVKNGAKHSLHVQKIAVDIHIADKTIEDAQPYLKKLAIYWKKITNGQGRWGGDWYGKQHDPWHFDLGTPICA